MSHTYEFPRAALAVDCVVFGFDKHRLQVLLIRRGAPPFMGSWALPGGFVRMDETLDEAARRELGEETGVADIYLEQLYTFGDIGRDPRGRTVSVAYYALIDLEGHVVKPSTDAAEAAWFTLDQVPDLAFDHKHILDTALERIRGKVKYQPIGFELLPEQFTLSQLQKLYEVVLGKELDKRNFRKKVAKIGLVEETGTRETGVRHRAAMLYRFDKDRYHELQEQGFVFDL